MLESIAIKNFALIEELTVNLTAGLNILTGETGAGKSILIDALTCVLGAKAGAGTIRSGSEKASIEAVFRCSATVAAWLKKQELADADPPQVVVAREITKSASRLRINGTLVNQTTMQELAGMLLTVHAQHEARTLMSSQSQLELLDSLGDIAHRKLLDTTRTLYAKKQELLAWQKELNGSQEDRLRRLDFARFQLNELEEANMNNANEDEELEQTRRILANTAKLEALINSAYSSLTASDAQEAVGAVDLLQASLAESEKAEKIDDRLNNVLLLLRSALSNIEEAATNMRHYLESLESNPEKLATMEARIFLLAAMKRKYGPTLLQAIERREQLVAEISNLANSKEKSDALESELKAVQAHLSKTADILSDKRQLLSRTLAKSIETQLKDLGMEHCRFQAQISKLDEIAASGQDKVEFMIAPNPGHPLMPLSKIASGGELSRIMLAIKTIFAKADQVATVIFDEIDTGLSGRVLQSMRDKLAQLSKSHQVLCVTHQPLIASIAENHIEVEKRHSSGATSISATSLTKEQRLTVLAQMASGQENEAVALNFARSLLEQAQKAVK